MTSFTIRRAFWVTSDALHSCLSSCSSRLSVACSAAKSCPTGSAKRWLHLAQAPILGAPPLLFTIRNPLKAIAVGHPILKYSVWNYVRECGAITQHANPLHRGDLAGSE